MRGERECGVNGGWVIFALWLWLSITLLQWHVSETRRQLRELKAISTAQTRQLDRLELHVLPKLLREQGGAK